jgi:hypothetical protein
MTVRYGLDELTSVRHPYYRKALAVSGDSVPKDRPSLDAPADAKEKP